MIPISILFYWSKGAETRRRILFVTNSLNKQNKPCFLNILAKELGLTHVALKKHLDLLIEEKYIQPLNPLGKPVYLTLTDSGKKVLVKFSH